MSLPPALRNRHPAEAVQHAAAEAAAAQAAVERASRMRLNELMRGPSPDRLAGLDDPTLVQADRVRLRRSLQVDLMPSQLARILPRRRIAWAARGLARSRGPAVRFLLVLVAFALPVIVALHRRAEPAVLTEATLVTLMRPDGSQIEGTLPAGVPLLVRRLDATRMEAREWHARQGYLTFAVPLSHVRLTH